MQFDIKFRYSEYAVCTVQYAMFIVQHSVCSVQYALQFDNQFKMLYAVQCTVMCNIQFAVRQLHKVCNKQHTVNRAQCCVVRQPYGAFVTSTLHTGSQRA